MPVMGCPDTGVRLYVSVRLPAPLYEMRNGMPRGMLAGAGDAPNDTALPAWTACAVCATGLHTRPGACAKTTSAIAADTAGCGGIINALITMALKPDKRDVAARLRGLRLSDLLSLTP